MRFIDPLAAPDAAFYGAGYFRSAEPGRQGYADYAAVADAPLYGQVLAALEQAGAPKRGLLDIGCAAGFLLATAARRGWVDLTGTDISAHCQSLQSGSAPFRFHPGDFLTCPLPAGEYHVITALDVIEHTASPRRFLEKCRTLLAPGGWLALVTPNDFDNLAARLSPAGPELIKFPEHLYYFSPRSLRRAVRDAGFTIFALTTTEAKFDKCVPLRRRGWSAERLASLRQQVRERHPRLDLLLERFVRLTGTGGTLRLVARKG